MTRAPAVFVRLRGKIPSTPLCKELPELSEEAQALYSEARERSALLLGKIKALESLLSSRGSRK